MKMLARFCVVFLLGLLLARTNSSLNAQDNFDQMFEEMMREFFPQELLDEIDSIREKGESPAPGKSFYRDDPRFLEIKKRQLRERKKDEVEKQHPENLSAFRPLAVGLSESVVSIHRSKDSKQRLALGTAVAPSGLLVTKASELGDEKKLYCVSAAGKKFTAEVVKVDKANDLALIKTEEKISPIKFVKSSLDEGTLLVTVGSSNEPVSVGTLAVKPRSIIGKNRGFLGVEPGPAVAGVLIKSVTRGSAAFRAGVQPGDIIKSISGKLTGSVAGLVREIGSRKKGDSVQLLIDRDGREVELEAVLDGSMIRGERAARFEMMRRLGAVISRRHDEFPSVIEHDSPILPDECGSPLVDLDGNVIGINIARAGRTNSYALPMKIVKDFVDSYRG